MATTTTKITYEQLSDLIESYEAMDDDMDFFLQSWTDILNGDDIPCPESDTKLHQVSDGSCDLCGDKNRN